MEKKKSEKTKTEAQKTDAKSVCREVNKPLNARGYMGRTDLIEATLYGFVDAVRALLNAGAKVDIKDNFGKTAIDYAKNHWGKKSKIYTVLMEASKKTAKTLMKSQKK